MLREDSRGSTARKRDALRSLSVTWRDYVDTHAHEGWVVGWIGHWARSPLRPTAVVAAPGAVSDSDRPRVTVVIPCYNYGRFLPDAVASAVEQEGVEVEVVVVDDCSTDGSAEVADRLAQQHSCVTVVRNLKNIGHVRAFNRGYVRATGEFIVRLDADDLLTPGSLRRATALFRAFPDVGLVYGYPRHFSSTVPPAASEAGRLTWTVWSGREWLAERCRVGVNCITTPEAMVRASVMRDVGPLDLTLRFAQDMEMWCRVAAVSDVGRVGGADQALHRDHDGSMSVNEGSGLLVDMWERAHVFDAVFSRVGDRVADAAALEAMARRTLAEESLVRAAHEIDRGRADAEFLEGVIDFARDRYPDWAESHEAQALAARSANPSRRDRAHRMGSAIAHRWKEEVSYAHWVRHGV